MTDAALTSAVPDHILKVIEGLSFPDQKTNVPDDKLAEHVRASIRRGHPQLWPSGLKGDRVALVGGGPSLEATFTELLAIVRDGAKLVTVNGSYGWCLARNLQPTAQIVVDARPSSRRFVLPNIPRCRYYLASQCDPTVWDAVAGRPFVGIWHSVAESDNALASILNDYYARNWHGVNGGTTVITRALGLLRMLGYLRFDLFGVDSCFLDDRHHAYPQPENDADTRFRTTVHPTGHHDMARDFWCAPWHLKQAEDFTQFVRVLGDKFLLNVHGDGLIAYMLRSSADVVLTQTEG